MMRTYDLRRLALEAICSERTARRWRENPEDVSENSRIRLERAAQRLGLPLPQSPLSAAH